MTRERIAWVDVPGDDFYPDVTEVFDDNKDDDNDDEANAVFSTASFLERGYARRLQAVADIAASSQ